MDLSFSKRHLGTRNGGGPADTADVFKGNRGGSKIGSTSGDNLIKFTNEVVIFQPEGVSLLAYYSNQNGHIESDLLNQAISLHDIHYRTIDLVRYYVNIVMTILNPPDGYLEEGEEDDAKLTSFFLDTPDEQRIRKKITGRIKKFYKNEQNDIILQYMWRKMESHMRSQIPEFSKELLQNLTNMFNESEELYSSEDIEDQTKAANYIRKMLLDKALLPNSNVILETLTTSIKYILGKGWSLNDMNLGNVVLYLKPEDEEGPPKPDAPMSHENIDEYEGYIRYYIDVKMIDWKYSIPPEITKINKYNAWDEKFGRSEYNGTTMSSMKTNMESWPMYVFDSKALQKAVEDVDKYVEQLRF